jgi:hypothetical protein
MIYTCIDKLIPFDKDLSAIQVICQKRLTYIIG